MATPKVVGGEQIMLPAIIRSVADQDNIDIVVFDEVIHLRRDDLLNWALAVSGPTGGPGPGGTATLPASAAFPPASVLDGNARHDGEWHAAQIKAGKKKH